MFTADLFSLGFTVFFLIRQLRVFPFFFLFVSLFVLFLMSFFSRLSTVSTKIRHKLAHVQLQ